MTTRLCGRDNNCDDSVFMHARVCQVKTGESAFLIEGSPRRSVLMLVILGVSEESHTLRFGEALGRRSIG